MLIRNKNCRWLHLCLLMLNGLILPAQSDTSSRLRWNVNAGLIFNNTFSNISEKQEVLSEGSVINRTPYDSAGKYSAGFSLGLEAITGKGEKLNAAFGISFSRTSAAHHYSYVEESPTTKTGFTRLKRSTEHDITEKYSNINIHAGLRNRITDQIFLTSAFVLNKPLRVRRVTNGYTETIYSSNGPLTETSMSYLINEEKIDKKSQANLSLRFTAEYQFTLNEQPARVYLFRNFGLIYTLPWWGLGFSYTFKS